MNDRRMVYVAPGEPIESALQRFRRNLEKTPRGEFARHECFIPRGERRRRKARQARKRLAKAA